MAESNLKQEEIKLKILKYNLINSCVVAVLFIFSTPLIAVTADLTETQWVITGDDDAGGIWDGSTLHFETQVMSGQDYDLSGYFEWVGSGNQAGSFGRENFTGTLFSDNQIELVGFEIVPPSNNVVIGGYSGTLTASGSEITEGRWAQLAAGPGVIPGSWSAVRVVPIPATILLFGSGLLGLIGISRRKKQHNF